MLKPAIFAGLLVTAALLSFPGASDAQIDQICGESGGSAWLNERVVYGQVTIKGRDPSDRFPKVTVILNNRGRDVASHTVDRSGYFCFRDVDGSEGLLIVEMEGAQVARQMLPSSDLELIRQFRQDFEIFAPSGGTRPKPAAISAKPLYTRNDPNSKLYEKASAAASGRNVDEAIKLYREIVAADPGDFIVWSEIGALYFERQQYPNAKHAFESALKAKPDLSSAMMNLGRIYLIEGNLELAVDVLKRATVTTPSLARAFQLLGEAYLLSKKGTLGVEALNEAIRLDPVGMAESHLLLATLYDRAGAKFMATREYKLFLDKVPDHEDAKKFRRYIEENPDEGQ